MLQSRGVAAASAAVTWPEYSTQKVRVETSCSQSFSPIHVLAYDELLRNRHKCATPRFVDAVGQACLCSHAWTSKSDDDCSIHLLAVLAVDALIHSLADCLPTLFLASFASFLFSIMGNSSNSRSDHHSHSHSHTTDNADERTPLLNGKNHRSSSPPSRNIDDDDHHSNSDSASSHHSDDDDSDSYTLISNLGDFTLQPSTLSKAVAEKDISILREALSENNGDIFEALQTDEKKGLQNDQTSEDGRKERRRVYGKNALPEKKLMPFWRFLWDAFNDKVLIILTVAAAVSFGLGLYQDFGPQHDPDEPRVNWVEGVAISVLP